MRNILTLLTIIPFLAVSQERINKQLPKINPAPISQIIKAVGWLQNSAGQWISKPNLIPAYLETSLSDLSEYGYYQLGTDNFTNFSLHKIKIDDTDYLILIKLFKDGHYRYPTLQQDFITYQSCYFYVFDLEMWEQSKPKNLDTSFRLNINTKVAGAIGNINQSNYLKKIELKIQEQLGGNSLMYESQLNDEISLVIETRPSETKEKIQFIIYGDVRSGFSGLTGFVANTTIQLFYSFYYETSKSTILNLFQMKK